MCVQEEGILVIEQCESIMLVSPYGKGNAEANLKEKSKISPQIDIKKEDKCYF